MKNELDGIKCPKCGGTSGAYFAEWQRWTCYYKWDGTPNGGEQGDGKGGGMMYCIDCGSPICRTANFPIKER